MTNETTIRGLIAHWFASARGDVNFDAAIPNDMADFLMDFLRDAGYLIVPDNGWEWGTVNTANGNVLVADDEAHARRINELSTAHYPVVRRHPATGWEPAP